MNSEKLKQDFLLKLSTLRSRRYVLIWLIVLFFLSIAFSVTIAQWWHEFGHVSIALVSGAPITEFKYWPPLEQHVTANFSSLYWQRLSLVNGFLITAIPLSVLFIFSVYRSSDWAYIIVFPLFQTVATSYGDLKAVDLQIPSDLAFVLGWIVPSVIFLLTIYYARIRWGRERR